MSYNIIKNTGGQYTNENADGSIYTYMNPNGNYVVADALTTPITTQYIGSKIAKDIGNFSIDLTQSSATMGVNINSINVGSFSNAGLTIPSPYKLIGDVSGNITGTATNVTATDTNTDGTYYPAFVSGTGSQGIKIDSSTLPFSYSLTSGVGNLTVRDKISVTESSGTTNQVVYETDPSGNIQIISNNSNANVNIGTSSKSNQANNCVAIGDNAGSLSQGQYCIAIGTNAGASSQTYASVCLGVNAGNSSAGQASVLIGANAGQSSSGNNTIIINASGTSQGGSASNIILNAQSASAISSSGTNRFYVAPIRNATNQQLLQYDTTNKEVTYSDTLTLGGITYANTYGSFTSTTSVQVVTLVQNDNYVFCTISTPVTITALLPSGSTNGQKYRVKLVYSAVANKPTVRINCVNTSETIVGISGVGIASSGNPYNFSTSNNFVEFVYFNGIFYTTVLV